jgi:hypothetical protein
VFEDEVCASLVAGFENRLGVPEVGAAPEPGAAEPPPPKPENSDGAEDVAVVAEEAPVVAVLVAGAFGFAKLKPPPVEAATPPSMLLLGAAEEVGAAVFPPKERAGCEELGCAADVAPRPNDGFAGIEEGVVLPRPPNRLPAGLGVCASCAPDVVAWLPPPNRFDEDVEVGAALLFAVFPSLKSEGVLELPRVFPADCPEGAPPNMPGVEDDGVAAGFAPPNKDGVEPPWLFCWPNKEPPDWAPPFTWV